MLFGSSGRQADVKRNVQEECGLIRNGEQFLTATNNEIGFS
jgi:hypothetical protein